MKFLDIKMKITLWYSFFMVVLVAGILGAMVEFTDMTILTNQKSQLVEVVEDASEDIAEGDDFDYFDDGVYLMLYDSNGKYINGSIPNRFSKNIPLKIGQVQTLKENEEMFYVYDRIVYTEYGKEFWLRGVISDAQTGQLTKTIVTIAFIILPVLVILSIVIGYFITKRAFLPVKKIQETAQSIAESKELSLRIGLKKGNDEISKLGSTIDLMLEKLERSFKKEKQFTSDVSHELRTPISVIMAESEYILKYGDSLEEAKESMEVINRQVEKMSALINQLLFFARADQGSLELKKEEVDVEREIENLIEENKISQKSQNEKEMTIKFSSEIEKNKKYSVDKILFIRAIQNILQNAINYSKEKIEIEIRLFEKENYFGVLIEDKGIGISKENLEKIWDRFYQVDEARTSKSTGSMGLGLSMVKLIIELHQGKIEVISEIGEGSRFILYFSKNL